MKYPTIDETWPTFRGVCLTAKEREFGLIITPIFPHDVPNSRRLISRDHLWMGRGGRLFYELRYGCAAMETIDNRATLTVEGVQKLNAEAKRVHQHTMALAGQHENEREMIEDKVYQIVIERQRVEIPTSGSAKNKAA